MGFNPAFKRLNQITHGRSHPPVPSVSVTLSSHLGIVDCSRRHFYCAIGDNADTAFGSWQRSEQFVSPKRPALPWSLHVFCNGYKAAGAWIWPLTWSSVEIKKEWSLFFNSQKSYRTSMLQPELYESQKPCWTDFGLTWTKIKSTWLDCRSW